MNLRLPFTFLTLLKTAPLFAALWAFIFFNSDRATAIVLHQNAFQPTAFILSYAFEFNFWAAVVVLGLILSRNYPQWRFFALWSCCSILGMGLWGFLLKASIGRARPPLLFNQGIYDFHHFTMDHAWWSAPSGHSYLAAMVFFLLASLKPRFKGFCALGVMAMMSIRVLAGAHYPSDTLLGAYLGALWCAAVYSLLTRWIGSGSAETTRK